MYEFNKSYFTKIAGIPAEVRERIFSRFIKMDYVNTEFVVERQGKTVPWRLRWKQDGRVRGITLGMDDHVAEAVKMAVSKRYLQELGVALTLNTRAVYVRRQTKIRLQHEVKALKRDLIRDRDAFLHSLCDQP